VVEPLNRTERTTGLGRRRASRGGSGDGGAVCGGGLAVPRPVCLVGPGPGSRQDLAVDTCSKQRARTRRRARHPKKKRS
jgi:hypothetical protein